MQTPIGFATAGIAPKYRSISAVALYDASGTIHHMHHVVTLEGGRDVDAATMIRDATAHAERRGLDVSKLQARHFTTIPNPRGVHRVDIATHTLVEVALPRDGSAHPDRHTQPTHRR